MKKLMMLAAGLVAVSGVAMVQPAEAGCLSGAVVGGAVGHYAGHHGLIGAGIGCAVGHHRQAVRDRDYERSNDYRRY